MTPRCSDCLSRLIWCEDQWVCLECGAEWAPETVADEDES